MADMMGAGGPEIPMSAAKDLADKMLSPEGQTAMAPLQAVLDEKGAKMRAEDVMIYAQKIPALAGKTPAELADAIKADAAILDDLDAQASGKMDKMKAEMGAVTKKKPESPAEGSMPKGGENMNFEKKVAEMESKAKASEMPPMGGM